MKKKDLIFDISALTDTGIVRKNNEDSVLVLDSDEVGVKGIKSCGIYLVADGMGGHQAGEVASDIAIEIISETLSDSLKQDIQLPPNFLIKQAVEKANMEIYSMARSKPQLFNMGTTVTVGLRLDDRLYIGHVGDSRAYLLRKGRIHQLTEDHSLVACLLKEGLITAEEAKTHPERNKIYRCLGISTEIDVDSYRKVGGEDWLLLRGGDTLVFCTDGLSSYVSDAENRDCLLRANGAESACRELVRLANLNGGEDNISVIVVRVISASAKSFFSKKKTYLNVFEEKTVTRDPLKQIPGHDRIGVKTSNTEKE